MSNERDTPERIAAPADEWDDLATEDGTLAAELRYERDCELAHLDAAAAAAGLLARVDRLAGASLTERDPQPAASAEPLPDAATVLALFAGTGRAEEMAAAMRWLERDLRPALAHPSADPTALEDLAAALATLAGGVRQHATRRRLLEEVPYLELPAATGRMRDADLEDAYGSALAEAELVEHLAAERAEDDLAAAADEFLRLAGQFRAEAEVLERAAEEAELEARAVHALAAELRADAHPTARGFLAAATARGAELERRARRLAALAHRRRLAAERLELAAETTRRCERRRLRRTRHRPAWPRPFAHHPPGGRPRPRAAPRTTNAPPARAARVRCAATSAA
jgi:hypothetical protein